MRALALLLVLTATPAFAQVVQPNTNTYLVFPTQAQALARSQSQCQALGCDGKETKYWWNVVGPLSAGPGVAAGSYAVEVQPSGPFAQTTTNKVAPNAVGLSAGEKSTLVPGSVVQGLLPVAGAAAIP